MTSGQPRRPKPPRPVLRMRVMRVEDLTPHMRRIYLGGPAFAEFHPNAFTDAYVKLLFAPPGTTIPDVYDVGALRRDRPADQIPVTRTFTVRHVDPAAAEFAIDIAIHGDQGLATPWAKEAQPGDEIALFGPGGAYAPSASADWHLMAGDDAALPAIGAAIEAVPDGARVRAIIEVDGPADEQTFVSKGDVDVTWLHRNGAPAGDVFHLVETVKTTPWLDGTPHVFVHGEAGLMTGLRRWFLHDRAVPRGLLSISGYWRTGLNEQGFRRWKAEQREAETVSPRP